MASGAADPEEINADIGLAVDDHTRHWLYFQANRTDAERRSSLHKTDVGGEHISVKQKIRNGRGVEGLTLDEASFELVRVPTQLTTEEFYGMARDPELVKRYYAEVQSFVRGKLGCDEVVCFHHQVRNEQRAGEAGIAAYAGGAPHTDSSSVSGDALALDMLAHTNGFTEGVQYKRFLYLNLWRSIADEPIENDHLAVLDERSVAKPDDYIAKDLFGTGYSVVQYSLSARHAAQHRWYYFPRMAKDEAILFKQVDSDITKPGRFCFHMAVKDPAAGAGQNPRQSIETRMMCYWKEADIDSMPTMLNTHPEMRKDPRKLAQTGPLLKDATCLQLLGALVLGVCRGSKDPSAKRYSGRPEDYLRPFRASVQHFASWPETGKQWVSTVIARDGVEKGIRTIVHTMAQDSTGFFGTQSFSPADQKQIAEFLLSNDDFMLAARHNFVAPSSGQR